MDFDPGAAVVNVTAPGIEFKDQFIAKYTSSGDFLWVRSIEASGIYDSVVDKDDNLYVSGWFGGTAQIGNETLYTPDESPDAFVAKIDGDGNFVWAENTNTTSYDLGRGIAVDDTPLNSADWSVYMATDFGGGTPQSVLWKFDSGTGISLWTKEIRGRGKFGSGTSDGVGVAVDDTGDVYLAGKFWGTVYFDDIKLTETNHTSDLFVSRLDSAGNFLWAKQFAGNGSSNSSSNTRELEVDDQNVYVLGSFGRFTPLEPLDFDPSSNTFELTSAGDLDGFVLALDKTGGDFAWATRLGGTGFDDPHDLDVYQGNIYVTGQFSGMADFGGQTLTSAGGGFDGFVSQIDSSGNFVQTWQIGGPERDEGWGIAVDTSGNVYASGRFDGVAEFPNGDQLTSQGGPDGFVLKFTTEVPNNLAPIANAGGPYIGSEDAATLFDASGSSDPDLDPLNFQWNFGDGTTANTTSPTISHTYAWGGSFAVSLTVSDGRGGFDSTTATATIAEVNDIPSADAGGPYSGNEGVAIMFDASASTDFDNQDGTLANDQSLAYTWDFGDGSGSITTASPTTSYTYSTAGNFNVSVNVSDGFDFDIALTTATIAAPPVGNSNDIYVWDINIDQRIRGNKHDARIFVDVNRDSDADGMASGSDDAATGVAVTIDLREAGMDGIFETMDDIVVGMFSGLTDSAGIYDSNWIRDLAPGTYRAEVIDLAHATFNWNQLLTPNDDDEDGDGLPDDIFAILA